MAGRQFRGGLPASALLAVFGSALLSLLLFSASGADARKDKHHARLAGTAAAAQVAERPNVLVIVTDDQPLPETMQVMPKTRGWFANQGVTFTEAFATTPLCCPARASIFSGRYSHNHGVLQNSGRGELDTRYTFQRYLRDAGYQTAIFGKFLNNFELTINPPDFDRWAVTAGSYYRFGVNDQGNTHGVPSTYHTHYVRDKALGFIRDAAPDPRPWLMYVGTVAPHPWAEPEPQYQQAPVPPFIPTPNYFEADMSDKPSWLRSPPWTPAQVEAERPKALRTLMSVDDMVDALFRELEARGEGNTIAFFISDNGWLWGQHRQWSKSLPYMASIRVPFFMRWPGHTPAATVDERLVGNIDLAPTVLDAAGVSPWGVPPMDGRSLLDPSWTRDRLLLEFWADVNFRSWAGLLTRDYQYTEWYDYDAINPLLWPQGEEMGGFPEQEYYDRHSDPWQLSNILHDGIALNDPNVGPLSRQLRNDRRCVGTRTRPTSRARTRPVARPSRQPPPCP